MPTLDEIPGALERPGGCRIEIIAEDDGGYVITIPPRGLPTPLIAGAWLLALNLMVLLYTGIMLLVAHHSVLLMTEISPHDLPLPMRPMRLLLLLGLLGAEVLGAWLLLAIVRPSLTGERLVIRRDDVCHEEIAWRRVRRVVIPRRNVQAFHLRRDPHGLLPGVLTLRAGRETIPLAEYVPEAEREWLVSVGNVLLRR